MRKVLICMVLAVVYIFTLSLASAEVSKITINASGCTYNRSTDVIAPRIPGAGRVLMDADGNILTTEEYRLINSSAYHFFETKSYADDELHNKGLIDDTGHELLPPIYMDIKIESEKWQIGLKGVPGTEEEYDFWDRVYGEEVSRVYMLIDTADVYYDGTCVGTLNREEYANESIAYGDYICIRNRNDEYIFYNKDFEQSPWKADNHNEYVEATLDGKKAIVHQGTGMAAFTSDCTLTADQVEMAYRYQNGDIIDLQGNVVCHPAVKMKEITSYANGYFGIWNYDKQGYYGVIDMEGNEVVPCEYDTVSADKLAEFGFSLIRKGDKWGMIDVSGNILIPCEYTYQDGYSTYGTLIIRKTENDDYQVITPYGELPERYAYVDMYTNAGVNAFIAKRADGTNAVISLKGEELIPFTESEIEMVNNKATVALVWEDDQTLAIYHFDGE